MIKFSYDKYFIYKRQGNKQMKKTYKAQNINCINCANLIKGSLEDEFGEIEVNLETTPKEVTVEIIEGENEAQFINEMQDLGFDIIDE